MYQDIFFRELVVDNFAGGGGASTGLEFALGYPVDIAINHDFDALAMHKVNHPHTQHFQEDVFAIDPEKITGGRPVGIAWFSPDCKHFSRAKGGKPVEKKIRGLSWVVLRWALSSVAPRIIFMENVPEIKTWGPLIEIDGKMRPDPQREGETFDGFISMLTTGIAKTHPSFFEACEFLNINHESDEANRLSNGLGYKVECKELKACDYGAPTIRKRFYLVARKDGRSIVFPLPTYGNGLKPYRTAAECIDMSIPCPSIFDRKKPLVENTMRRIARGLEKFVVRNPKPFIIQMNFENAPQDIKTPLSTITAINKHYVVNPYIVPIGYGERQGQAPRVNNIEQPLSTIVSSCKQSLCIPLLKQYNNTNNVPHGIKDLLVRGEGTLNACFISKYFSGEKQSGASIEQPLPTVTGIDHNSLISVNLSCHHDRGADSLVIPALSAIPKHYDIKIYLRKICTMHEFGKWAQVRELLNKHAGYSIADDEILIIEINKMEYFISDVGMRMLKARELMLAQGFPSDYIIDIESHINKKYSESKQIARMGNAVCPPVAEALIRANCIEMVSHIEINSMQKLNAVINDSCNSRTKTRSTIRFLNA